MRTGCGWWSSRLTEGSLVKGRWPRPSRCAAARPSSKVSLVEALRVKDLLLVLDNCEHWWTVRPASRRAAQSCPELRILATSREILGPPAEAYCRCRPLGTGPGSRETAETLEGYESCVCSSSGHATVTRPSS